MPTVKFTVSDAHYQELTELAQKEGMSIQDYIRSRLFHVTTIFTPEEAVRRALEQYAQGDTFTVPELYGKDWSLKQGEAGIFGKRFFHYVLDHCQEQIQFTGMTDSGRHAQYKVL